MKILLCLFLLIPNLLLGNHKAEKEFDSDKGVWIPIKNKCIYDDNKEDYFNYLREIKSCDSKTGLEPANTEHFINKEFFEIFLANHIQKPLKFYMGMTPSNESEGLIYHLRQVLDGPPDEAKLIEDRYLILSGCRHQSCSEKGFLWIDTKNKKIIAVINHYFFNDNKFIKDGAITTFTNDFQNKDEIPNIFKRSLDEWLINLDVLPRHYYFIGSGNSILDISKTKFE